VIAVIVGGEEMQRGPIPLALAHAGFDAHEASSADAADVEVSSGAEDDCVLILDSGCLDRPANGGTWRSFLAGRERLPAVVVACGRVPEGARGLAAEPHRIVLESPFDAAAVVAAARQASERRRAARSVGRPLFVEAG
jgi:hypothetical protein